GRLRAWAGTATGSSWRTTASASRSRSPIVSLPTRSRSGSRRSMRAARRPRSRRRSLDAFETVSEQPEAKRLLRAALDDALAHAYLFHGPAGVGKRDLAKAFAAELLGDGERVARGTHPDLYVLEPLGDQIRIDAIRQLRHDL